MSGMSGMSSSFGKNLLRFRAGKGMCSGELERRCSLAAGTIERLESGRETPSDYQTVERIARELGVPPLTLFASPGPDFMEHFPESTIRLLLERGEISIGRGAQLLGIDYEEAMKIAPRSW